MIITCEACNASFNLDDNLLKQTGSKVRCSKCRNVFVAHPTVLSAEPDESSDERPDAQTKPEEFSADADENGQTGIDDTGLAEEETDFDDALDIEDDALDIEEDTGEVEEFGFDLGMGIDEVAEAEEDFEEEAGMDLEDIGELELEGMEEEPELDIEPDIEVEGDGDLEDLDLELDVEEGPEIEEGAEEFEDGIDLEDIGELELEGLEEEPELDIEPDIEVEGDGDLEDLDLELGIAEEPETEEGAEEVEAGIDLEDIGELELEGVEEEPELEAESESAIESAGEPEDLDVALGLDETGDLDLSDTDGMPEVETPSESDGMEGGEIEDLESDGGEESLDDDLSEDPSAIELYEVDEITDDAVELEDIDDELEESFSMGDEADESEGEELEGDAVADAGIEEDVDSPPAGKKRISTPILALIIIVFLAGGGYGAYAVLSRMSIEIPFLTKAGDKDPAGNLKIDTFDVKSKFIDNATSGKIFIITGQVKNGYEEIRGFIGIKASIYKKGKVLERTEMVFCGNYLSDLDLANSELDVIKKRLSNRNGDNRSNMKVQPGQILPFMVIFSNLPDTLEVLEEFTVEVAESSKV